MTKEPAIGRQEAKSAAARERICAAAVQCLAELGYAETSINKVVERAQMSKGALQHHFPTKEDLMAATAERLLANATLFNTYTPKAKGGRRDTAAELLRSWKKLVDTTEYRALLEILVAIRTNADLQKRLSPALKRWHRKHIADSIKHYKSPAGSDEDVGLLLALNMSMMRGLIIHEQYDDDPATILKMMKRWSELVAPHLLPREAE